jgi:hypothetical protein
MKIKFLPCSSDHDSKIIASTSDSIMHDGRLWEFDEAYVAWDKKALFDATGGDISEAHRENGELYLTMIRFYVGSCSEWDDGQYHEMQIGATV